MDPVIFMPTADCSIRNDRNLHFKDLSSKRSHCYCDHMEEKTLAFDQISEVKIEDGFIFLVLKKGCVEKMPSWLGANRNLFHRLKIELKLLRGK